MSIGINFDSDWNELTEKTLKEKAKRVVIKPWGKYETIYIGEGYKVKIITVNPGQRLSLQRHRWRTEHWVIIEGQAIATKGFSHYNLYKDWDILIFVGEWHRIENKQQTPLVFVEVQVGYCFEEDIERKEDDYGRIK